MSKFVAVKEALQELQTQKISIEQAIKSLQEIIASSTEDVKPKKIGAVPTCVEATESVLASRGKPMRIKELVFEINKLRGLSLLETQSIWVVDSAIAYRIRG